MRYYNKWYHADGGLPIRYSVFIYYKSGEHEHKTDGFHFTDNLADAGRKLKEITAKIKPYKPSGWSYETDGISTATIDGQKVNLVIHSIYQKDSDYDETDFLANVICKNPNDMNEYHATREMLEWGR